MPSINSPTPPGMDHKVPPLHHAEPQQQTRRRFLSYTLYAALALLLLGGVTTFTRPRTSPHEDFRPATTRQQRLGLITQTGAIPPSAIPSAERPDRRLIFIGDVHGMYNELQKLLQRLSYDPTTDHLVLTGDITTKGPASGSLRTLHFLRTHPTSCVRGNHDDRILLHYSQLSFPPRTLLPNTPISAAESRIRAERRLAQRIPKADAEWLDACPLILTAEGVPALGDVAVVHAGLVPGMELERQEPTVVMNIRSLDKDGRGRGRQGKRHWAKVWNKVEGKKENPRTVVYGHYAAKGLDIRPLTKGLDSGCAAGGRLTAMVVDARSTKPTFVDVKCRGFA